MKINKKCITALASFVLLMLQAFGLKFDLPVVNELISAAASVLVMLGIISDSGAGTGGGGDQAGDQSEKDEDKPADEETPPADKADGEANDADDKK